MLGGGEIEKWKVKFEESEVEARLGDLGTWGMKIGCSIPYFIPWLIFLKGNPKKRGKPDSCLLLPPGNDSHGE